MTSVLRSLLADDFVAWDSQDTTKWVLTEESLKYVAKGMPEVQLYHLIPEEGLPLADVAKVCAAAGFEAKVAQGALMKAKWASSDKKAGIIKRAVAPEEVTAPLSHS